MDLLAAPSGTRRKKGKKKKKKKEKKRKEKNKKNLKVEVKEEPVPKSVITMDIAVAECVLLGQEGSEDAKNEAPTVQDPIDPDGGSASNIDNDSFSDDSSFSSDSDSSSSSNESSIFSSSDTYALDLFEWKSK